MRSSRHGWRVRLLACPSSGAPGSTARLACESLGQLDYDDGLVPGQIVASVMHLGQVTHRLEHELGTTLRWSYGSAFGLLHGALFRRVGEPRTSLAFGAVLMTATFSLFPLLGHTPPPWRWPNDVIATSIATHVAYVAAVAAADDGLRRSAQLHAGIALAVRSALPTAQPSHALLREGGA